MERIIMVEHPGMWGEERSLFRVGTVAGVQRKWPMPLGCGVSTRFGGAWVSASIIGRRLTIEQEQKIVRTRPEPSAAPAFGMRSPVGAAEGCDLLIFIGQAPKQAQKRYAKSALC
ncbi:hypothetical protein C0J26_06135 [Pseudomonas baetica]|nr:hypothetical protein C0J26_06135 [Pseudomonas baetica]